MNVEIFMQKYDKQDCAYLIAVYTNLHVHGIANLSPEDRVLCDELLESLKERMEQLIG